MPQCGDLEPLLTAYVDGEASPADRAAIDTHLQKCPPCRSRVTGERTARELLAARRVSLKPCAPDGLRHRCAAHLGRDERAPAASSNAAAGRPHPAWGTAASQGTRGLLSRRTMLPLSMAATLFLAVAGVFFYGLTGSVEALAAQLVVDHVKCFQFGPGEAHDADAGALGQQWTASRGWALKVPASDATQQLQLLTVRRCASTEGLTAHLMYRWRGEPLSVYVLNSADPEAGSAGRLVEKLGREAVIWSDHGRTFAVVARARPADLEPVVRYVKVNAR